ncbi:uncharacterized protein LOC129597674 isoform X2 [Paramacrobiotus metropolitanus]|uniref:uncharacterized protein LOC129597674 isoform X2 n=1 Tax=Paramacrobiotus metropolitanus TaxID=2943436 RepID=UPI0024457284|nr:uncharacterized protein LOC129597674 isoform X2 [Paramacrobiotus metropolitanus]
MLNVSWIFLVSLILQYCATCQEDPAGLSSSLSTPNQPDDSLVSQNLDLVNRLFGGFLGAGGGPRGSVSQSGLFPGGASGILGANTGSASASNWMPFGLFVGDINRYNNRIGGECVLVGAKCKIDNSICSSMLTGVTSIGKCQCKSGFQEMNGECFSVLIRSAIWDTPLESEPVLVQALTQTH